MNSTSLPVQRDWRALVADDDDDTRALVARALRRAGFDVVEAANGQQLIDSFDALPSAPTIVVSDIGMPELDGIDAARVLHQKNPLMPIVLVTAFKDRLTTDSARDAGASQVLFKPLNISSLVQLAVSLAKGEV